MFWIRDVQCNLASSSAPKFWKSTLWPLVVELGSGSLGVVNQKIRFVVVFTSRGSYMFLSLIREHQLCLETNRSALGRWSFVNLSSMTCREVNWIFARESFNRWGKPALILWERGTIYGSFPETISGCFCSVFCEGDIHGRNHSKFHKLFVIPLKYLGPWPPNLFQVISSNPPGGYMAMDKYQLTTPQMLISNDGGLFVQRWRSLFFPLSTCGYLLYGLLVGSIVHSCFFVLFTSIDCIPMFVSQVDWRLLLELIENNYQ